MVVYRNSNPIVVIEVKTSVSFELYKVPPCDVMEMFIYHEIEQDTCHIGLFDRWEDVAYT